ncbi:DUF2254 domain-containing protein [Polaromonas sp.]|uniref:DUF2254 domain-containing protein n=1 Tax=Polaromonas sp. TaxID=1869339 RepID=UPI0013BB9025|nr:DUF2254 domain-containing protein [Polaromonas sp.]NDP63510.1 DUF2254 domain-containing protein [Polaromonas sp.]
MSEKLLYLLQRLLRKTWVRCALFSLAALLAVTLAKLLGPLIPEDIAFKLGSESIGSLLNILATSMLTVAVFSASTMVSSFAAVASTATPRASQLLIEDSTIQNTLATFVGAFLYSVIALVGLNAQVYGGGGRLVLFGFTLLILLVVVIVLLRWLDYLSVLGRVGETIRRVEEATIKAMAQRLHKPFMGGLKQAPGASGEHILHSPTTGFVQHVSMDILQDCAQQADAMMYLHVQPGDFVETSTVIASSTKALGGQGCKAVSDAVLIGPARTFDHDPRFGLLVMGEIAARALSPAVNDPGTAIVVLATAVRTMIYWVDEQRAQISSMQEDHSDAGHAEFDQVSAPNLHEAGMLTDVFDPLARHGALAVDVGVALQHALASLRRLNHTAFNPTLDQLSRDAIRRAEHAGLFEPDLECLREAALAERQARPG